MGKGVSTKRRIPHLHKRTLAPKCPSITHLPFSEANCAIFDTKRAGQGLERESARLTCGCCDSEASFAGPHLPHPPLGQISFNCQ